MLDVLLLSLVTAIAVGISAGYLGSLMVLEKMALVGDALSHVALPGLALGIVYNFNPLIGAFAFLFVSAVVIWQLGRVTRLSFETIVGAMFTLSLAVGILLLEDLGEPEALAEALFGDINAVTLGDAVAAVVLSVVAVLATRIIYKNLVLGIISEDLAISKGVNVARTNLLYLLLVSVVVAIGIKITGTLLVGFLVIVPAAAAKNLSHDLLSYSVFSAVFGLTSSVSGVLLSGYTGIRAGPLVVLSGIILFLVTVLLKWKAK